MGCPDNWWAPPGYPGMPCEHCPVGRFSAFTSRETAETSEASIAKKCTGVCEDYLALPDSEKCVGSFPDCPCGCAGSESVIGSTVTAIGTVSCSLCPAGKYDHDGDTKTLCELCPPGRFSDVVGATECAGVCEEEGTYAAPGQTSDENSCTTTPAAAL